MQIEIALWILVELLGERDMIHLINSYKECWCWNDASDTSYCFIGTKYSTLSKRSQVLSPLFNFFF